MAASPPDDEVLSDDVFIPEMSSMTFAEYCELDAAASDTSSDEALFWSGEIHKNKYVKTEDEAHQEHIDWNKKVIKNYKVVFVTNESEATVRVISLGQSVLVRYVPMSPNNNMYIKPHHLREVLLYMLGCKRIRGLSLPVLHQSPGEFQGCSQGLFGLDTWDPPRQPISQPDRPNTNPNIDG